MRRSANRDAGRVPGRGAEGRGTLRQCAGPPAASQWDAVSSPARAPSPLTPPLGGGAGRGGRGARERLKRGDRWAPPARAPNGRAPARGGLGASPQSRRARQDPWRAPGPTSPLQHRAHGIHSLSHPVCTRHYTVKLFLTFRLNFLGICFCRCLAFSCRAGRSGAWPGSWHRPAGYGRCRHGPGRLHLRSLCGWIAHPSPLPTPLLCGLTLRSALFLSAPCQRWLCPHPCPLSRGNPLRCPL